MEKSKTSNRYSPEMRARAVRMVLEHQGSYETQSAAVSAIAPKIGLVAVWYHSCDSVMCSKGDEPWGLIIRGHWDALGFECVIASNRVKLAVACAIIAARRSAAVGRLSIRATL